MLTTNKKSAIDLLPIKHPTTDSTYSYQHFYSNVVKPLVYDIVKIMNNGIPIDISKVELLEKTVEKVLKQVETTLSNNSLIKDFNEEKNNYEKEQKIQTLKQKEKSVKDFVITFNISNKVHRTMLVNTYLKEQNLYEKYGKIDNSDWTVKDLKELNNTLHSSFIERILNKDKLLAHTDTARKVVNDIAQIKANVANSKLKEKENSINTAVIHNTFNFNSATQKQEFFTYLGLTSEKTTSTGSNSWDRDSLEELLKTVLTKIDKLSEQQGD